MMAEWVSPERAFVVGLILGGSVGVFLGAIALAVLAGDNLDKDRR